MTILQHTSERLVVQAGTRILNETTLTLDRDAGVARIERTTLLIRREREEVPINEIEEIALAREKDPSSGAERYLPMLRLGSGRVLVLPPFDDRSEAEHTADKMRNFVGLA